LSWAVNLTPGLGTPSLGSSLVSWAISPSPFEPSLRTGKGYPGRLWSIHPWRESKDDWT